jgi:hypothetical protein
MELLTDARGMPVKMISLLLLHIIALACASFSPQPEARPAVEISTIHNTVTVNGKELPFSREGIIAILGMPDRTEELKSMERYEEYGGPNGKTSQMVEVENHFMIYDSLGLVFRTRNGFFRRSKDPEVLFIYTGNKRTFDNRIICEKEPAGKFSGTVTINGEAVPADKPLVSSGITYRSEKMILFGTGFGITSFAGEVDGVYSTSSPPVTIHFDNGTGRKASVIEIRKPVK